MNIPVCPRRNGCRLALRPQLTREMASGLQPEAVLTEGTREEDQVSLGEVREGFLEEAICKVDLRMVLEVHTNCVSSVTIKCMFSFSYLIAAYTCFNRIWKKCLLPSF